MAQLELRGKSRSITSITRWQLFVCLLLVALVLYNPYMSGAESGAGLCARHAASHRATVGASELQYFSPTDGRSLVAIAAFPRPQNFAPVLALEIAPHMATIEDLRGNTQLWPASLWFRPPPVI